MDEVKRKRLEAAGWTVGSVEDFLDLTPEESVTIEVKLSEEEFNAFSEVINAPAENNPRLTELLNKRVPWEL